MALLKGMAHIGFRIKERNLNSITLSITMPIPPEEDDMSPQGCVVAPSDEETSRLSTAVVPLPGSRRQSAAIASDPTTTAPTYVPKSMRRTECSPGTRASVHMLPGAGMPDLTFSDAE